MPRNKNFKDQEVIPVPRLARTVFAKGDRFGSTVIVGYVGKSDKGRLLWKCVCDCGSLHISRADHLKNRLVNSCGCGANVTHGLSRSAEYSVHRAMLRRCFSDKDPNYELYGGRGITVCDRWVESFENFIKDMGRRPSKAHSIDRIDTNGNYCPENCRWASRIEQARNMRSNRNIRFLGETKCVAEWSAVTGVPANTISHRLDSGWTVEDALTTPTGRRLLRVPPNA